MRRFRSSVACIVILLLLLPGSALAATPGVPADTPAPYSAMVSTAHPLASLVGARVLQEGGNAVDAAVATQFALNVVEPMMSGIGGGGFMMIYLAESKETVIIDCREQAPAGAKATMFLDANGKPLPFETALQTGHAVGVPGTLKGLVTALEKYGTKPLSTLIDPAIELAAEGIKVNRNLAEDIADSMYKFNEAAKQVFAPGEQPLPEGALLVQPDLAKTLTLIKDKGPAAFYEGEIGEALVKTVAAKGGTMTIADLKAYTPKFRQPVRGTYCGYELVTMPSPSSGGLTLLHMLKLLEGYDIAQLGHNTADTLHLMIESMHLAYADRNQYLGDTDFIKIPAKGFLDNRYIAERRALIDPKRASSNVKPGDPWKYENQKAAMLTPVPAVDFPGETTHFTVRDQWGNIVSYTTTIEDVFGSGMMVPGYGFMLNNEMTDFDFTPGGANEVAPGKRPRSSMTPTIVFKDGVPVFSVGSPGGSTIITTVLQVVVNLIDHKLPVQEAIDAPRIFSSSYPNVRWEAGLPEAVREELTQRGHKFEDQPSVIGSVQSIVVDLETGKLYGGADNRREGTVIGVLPLVGAKQTE